VDKLECRRKESLHEQLEPVAAPTAPALHPRQRGAIALIAHGAELLQVDAVAPGAPWSFQRGHGQPLARLTITINVG
jgi:hypothetical protein